MSNSGTNSRKYREGDKYFFDFLRDTKEMFFFKIREW